MRDTPSLALLANSYGPRHRPAGAAFPDYSGGATPWSPSGTSSTSAPTGTAPTVQVIPYTPPAESTVWTVLRMVSVGLSAYHGVKRNNGSLGWGLWWGFAGGLAPVITPAFAFAQGFGKRRGA